MIAIVGCGPEFLTNVNSIVNDSTEIVVIIDDTYFADNIPNLNPCIIVGFEEKISIFIIPILPVIKIQNKIDCRIRLINQQCCNKRIRSPTFI